MHGLHHAKPKQLGAKLKHALLGLETDRGDLRSVRPLCHTGHGSGLKKGKRRRAGKPEVPGLAPAGRAERAKYDFEIYFTTDPNSKVTLTCPKLTLPPTVETATTDWLPSAAWPSSDPPAFAS